MGDDPRRAINAVPTSPVSGSAANENKTGIVKVTNVLWGA